MATETLFDRPIPPNALLVTAATGLVTALAAWGLICLTSVMIPQLTPTQQAELRSGVATAPASLDAKP